MVDTDKKKVFDMAQYGFWVAAIIISLILGAAVSAIVISSF